MTLRYLNYFLGGLSGMLLAVPVVLVGVRMLDAKPVALSESEVADYVTVKAEAMKDCRLQGGSILTYATGVYAGCVLPPGKQPVRLR